MKRYSEAELKAFKDQYKGSDDTTLTTYQLYDKYSGVPLNIANKYITGVSTQVYEDMVQEGYIGLWKGCRAYVKNPQQPKANSLLFKYVSTAISNLFQSEYGRRDTVKREATTTIQTYGNTVIDDEGNEVELFNIVPSSTTNWDYITMWIDAKIYISTLSPQLQLVAYYILCGYLDGEIGRILDVSRSTVTRIHHKLMKVIK